jgi:hypothetical protein
VSWRTGDLFVLPYLGDEAKEVCRNPAGTVGRQCARHACKAEPKYGGCALYWVDDEPLLRYLGARPVDMRRFEPALYPAGAMLRAVGGISAVNGATGEFRNRRGILLSSPDSPQTKTLTPTLWSLLNSIGPNTTQAPHRHNSVALDLAVSTGDGPGQVFTLLGRELDAQGRIVDPLRVVWEAGGVFVTPPGWWHSHHNACAPQKQSEEATTSNDSKGAGAAWVLPMQDAGLCTHQRTLDIRFVADEARRLQSGVHRGTTVDSAATVSAEVEVDLKKAAATARGECNAPAPAVLAGTILLGHAS